MSDQITLPITAAQILARLATISANDAQAVLSSGALSSMHAPQLLALTANSFGRVAAVPGVRTRDPFSY